MPRREQQPPEHPLTWTQVFKAAWYFIASERTKYVSLLAFLSLVYFSYLIPPYVLGESIDFFTTYKPGDDLSYFYNLCIFIAVSTIVISFIRQFSKGAIAKISANTRYNVKVWGFDRLTSFSLEWHQQENTGNKVQRILTGSKAIENILKLVSNNLLVLIVTFIGTAVTAISINPSFIYFYVIYFVVILVTEFSFNRKLTVLLDEYNREIENTSGTVYESMSNMLAIKALGARDTVSQKVQSKELAAKLVTFKKIRLGNLKWSLFQTANGIFYATYLLMMGYEIINGRMSPGGILILGLYFTNLRDRIIDFAESLSDLLEIKADISRMMPIFWQGHILQTGNEKFPPRWNKIQLKNASFAYKADSAALKNINFTITRNEKIGIAGQSGSGKSTLAKIFLGLYQINDGSFTVGTQDYYSINHDNIINNITVVLQESELFNMSLRENITMMREIDDTLFYQALSISQLNELIVRLPQGVDTLIGEKGYALSGGERQRVGIARAIVRNAPIIILDEATSALDSTTEKNIMEALLGEYGQKKTMIIIAHRISTLKNTDQVYVFEKGEIIENGTFSQLAKATGSKFKELHDIQMKTN
ncbi:MAG: ABC transporter ATP-binding protein/permease [bacterium]|nr:ABC transporter ATP-binding protein/permease [bacterium]